MHRHGYAEETAGPILPPKTSPSRCATPGACTGSSTPCSTSPASGQSPARFAPVDLRALTADTGAGIPAEELPKIFDRFHRVRSPAARFHEATGIGLALVKKPSSTWAAASRLNPNSTAAAPLRSPLGVATKYGQGHNSFIYLILGMIPYIFLQYGRRPIPMGGNLFPAMKMTIEIPEDVLSELMQLTGHETKRQAVEYALREAARRAKWRRVWGEGLGLTPDQLAVDAAPKPSDLIDAPDIDDAAVRQALEGMDRRRKRRAQTAGGAMMLNEDQAPYDQPRP
jgi:Arc/MetJ family transcription regulator